MSALERVAVCLWVLYVFWVRRASATCLMYVVYLWDCVLVYCFMASTACMYICILLVLVLVAVCACMHLWVYLHSDRSTADSRIACVSACAMYADVNVWYRCDSACCMLYCDRMHASCGGRGWVHRRLCGNEYCISMYVLVLVSGMC